MRFVIERSYQDLLALGHAGSYDRVAAYARDWRRRGQEAARTAGRGTYVPLVFTPGGRSSLTGARDWAVIGGERRKVNVAQFKLCHSRAFILRVYPLQTHEMLFEAHNHAITLLGGVPWACASLRHVYDSSDAVWRSY